MPKILIADNDETFLYICSKFLQRSERNFEVVTVTDGQAAVNAAHTQKLDLILMDRYMPLMDGYEATLSLKKDPATANIPILGTGGISLDSEVVRNFLEAGCDDYLAKPFTRTELLDKVHIVLDKALKDGLG